LRTADWSSTAVVVAYDDSDGYYDHVFSGVHNPSNTANVPNPPGPQDFLSGTGLCGNTTAGTPLAQHPEIRRGQLAAATHLGLRRRDRRNAQPPVRLR
jgi:hypothetical protein